MADEPKTRGGRYDGLPGGLHWCDRCGGVWGQTVRVDEDGPAVVASTCWCDGPKCRRCGRVRSRRPISDYYDPVGRKWWHVPHFVGFMTICRRCQDKDLEKEADEGERDGR